LNTLLVFYINSFGYSVDELTYNFVSKEKLLEINKQFLHHNTHTDIITFDYTQNKALRAEFFISLWAVRLSAEEFSQSIENETVRAIAHGVLHCLGYKDKTNQDKIDMRSLEDEFIEMFHVKQNSNV
jgi:rRNA maturation RNase YbeY